MLKNNLEYIIIGGNCRVFVTGGASTNHSILQVLSDVFNADVFTQVFIRTIAVNSRIVVCRP